MNHTPGPWRVADHLNTHSVIGIYAGEDQLICELRDPEDDADIERMRANAPLIAAAAELLDALKRAEPHISRIAGRGSVLEQARLAIAKAEGRG